MRLQLRPEPRSHAPCVKAAVTVLHTLHAARGKMTQQANKDPVVPQFTGSRPPCSTRCRIHVNGVAPDKSLPVLLDSQVNWIKAHINTANVSSFCILLLVWLTFCNTFGNKTVRTVPGRDVAGTVFLDVALFIMFVVVCFVVAWPPPPLQALRRILRLSKPDAVAVVICGSTKTVAMGVPLISVMYKQVPYAGLLALPLIGYHALQVLLGGLMLDPLKKWCLAGASESKADSSDADAVIVASEQQLPVSVADSEAGRSSSRWGLIPQGLRRDKNVASSGGEATV